MGDRIAVRNRKRGPAHALSTIDDGTGPWTYTLCGRSMSDPEDLLWDATAPEDRCRTCAKRVAEGGAS